jgi:hypothetical protein
MVQVFISYSHADEKYRSELEKHLTILQRQGLISVWHDRRILAGDQFDSEINDNLLQAKVVLLLVSSDFLSSNYCYEIEMKTALERHKNGETRVIPVILRACDWQNSLFGKLMATPKDGKPVTRFTDIDEAFTEIVQAIRAALPAPKQPILPESLTPPRQTKAAIPKSANVFVKKEFSDEEKDSHLADAFEYMATFFQNSLEEICARNSGVTQNYRRIDANHFSATIYKHGKEANRCKIWLATRGSFGNGIAYSEGQFSGSENSMNDSLTVEDDGSLLYLRPLLATSHIKVSSKLTFEGAAEYYWARFVECLQR